MSSQYSTTAKSGAFGWFLHRITGTFLIFLLTTHFWIQHYDRTTRSISHDVITASELEDGVLPRYDEAANEAVRERMRQQLLERGTTVIPAAQIDTYQATPYDVLMLRLADPVYAVLWKGFNILFLIFALHHGFYGLNNILQDYIRNDMGRVVATSLTWGLALVLFIVGVYSVTVAGLNV